MFATADGPSCFNCYFFSSSCFSASTTFLPQRSHYLRRWIRRARRSGVPPGLRFANATTLPGFRSCLLVESHKCMQPPHLNQLSASDLIISTQSSKSAGLVMNDSAPDFIVRSTSLCSLEVVSITIGMC